jgi:hypothetical protein
VGLILWIDENTFATGLLEKVFKMKSLPFYTLNSVNDFSYLIEDLRPELLILDCPTAMKQLEVFKKQYETSELLQNLPVILIDESSELGFISKKIGQISRPFDPFKIPEIIENILKSH